jgi:DNA-binding beta-propeller fold protein YncE
MMTWPNEALGWTGQPLVYVSSNDGILVIDSGDNKVVDTISGPSPTAVAPDGKHVYAFGPSPKGVSQQFLTDFAIEDGLEWPRIEPGYS